MKAIALINLGIAVAATTSVSAATLETLPHQMMPAKKFCPIQVWFGSHGAGADRVTARAVIAYIEASPNIVRAIAQPWGREGELEICVLPRFDHLDSEFAALKALLPANSPYPTGIRKGTDDR